MSLKQIHPNHFFKIGSQRIINRIHVRNFSWKIENMIFKFITFSKMITIKCGCTPYLCFHSITISAFHPNPVIGGRPLFSNLIPQKRMDGWMDGWMDIDKQLKHPQVQSGKKQQLFRWFRRFHYDHRYRYQLHFLSWPRTLALFASTFTRIWHFSLQTFWVE